MVRPKDCLSVARVLVARAAVPHRKVPRRRIAAANEGFVAPHGVGHTRQRDRKRPRPRVFWKSVLATRRTDWFVHQVGHAREARSAEGVATLERDWLLQERDANGTAEVIVEAIEESFIWPVNVTALFFLLLHGSFAGRAACSRRVGGRTKTLHRRDKQAWKRVRVKGGRLVSPVIHKFTTTLRHRTVFCLEQQTEKKPDGCCVVVRSPCWCACAPRGT